MSKLIYKKPYIESILEACSEDDIAELISIINSPLEKGNIAVLGSTTYKLVKPTGTNVFSVQIDFGFDRVQSGICLFLESTKAYYLRPDKETAGPITIFTLTVNNGVITDYVKSEESVDIEELRRILGGGSGGGSLTPEALAEIMEGDTGISVELNEAGTKVRAGIDLTGGTPGKVLKISSDGEGVEWGLDDGLPEATEPDQVLVANGQLEPEWKDSVPLANNLSGTYGSVNDTAYSAGPTGGSADISNNGATLQEIKGMSIVWNQLVDAEHSYQLKSNHIYIYRDIYNNQARYSLYKDTSWTVSASSNVKVFDLTLMFGSNDKIPFSLTSVTEYATNGDIPAQICKPSQAFQRLFANVDLHNAPYDAGTIKNVSATKLTETGQNLFESNSDGTFNVIAGYRYEIYCSASTSNLYYKSANTWQQVSLNYSRREDGKAVLYYTPESNGIIMHSNYPSTYFKYIGFVHSGNYALTTGTKVYETDMPIPTYVKHEYPILGISNLNGIDDVCDTKDTTRIGSANLSELTWTAGTGTYSATVSGIKPSTTHILSTKYLRSEMSVDANGVITITSAESPTGTLLFELETPISTGESPFEPIALDVNDMGFEYFTGNDICPVNQKAFYRVNLKDKLVNLKVSDIKISSTYSSDAQPIGQIIIDDIGFRTVPIGNGTKQAVVIGIDSDAFNSASSVTIGYHASNQNHDSNVTIGSSASNYSATQAGVAIGAASDIPYSKGSVALGGHTKIISQVNFATAIGCYSYANVDNSVSFDGLGTQEYNQPRTLSLYNPSKMFFRNANITSSKTTFASYTSGHFLQEYIGLTVLTMAESAGVYTSSEVFTDTTNISGVHLFLEIETSGTHNVASCDLALYDGTSEHLAYMRTAVGGTMLDIPARIDSTGHVIIDLSSATGVTEITAKYHLYS